MGASARDGANAAGLVDAMAGRESPEMIVYGPVRPDVDPELASIDPVAASEWYGYVPDVRMGTPSALAAALRDRGATQLTEIIEAVEHDPRWGWLAVYSGLLMALTGCPVGDSLPQHVEEWLRLKGVRVIDERA